MMTNPIDRRRGIKQWLKTYWERRACPKCGQNIPWYRFVKRYYRLGEKAPWTAWVKIKWIIYCALDFKTMWIIHKVQYMEHVLGYHIETPHANPVMNANFHKDRENG